MSIKRETVEERKALPLASGVLDYFPDALLVVAEVSRVGNEQHHPGQPLHWDKSKSTDEADALLRHLLDRGTYDTDGLRHSGKVAWRALALLQRELDAEAAAQHHETKNRVKPSIDLAWALTQLGMQTTYPGDVPVDGSLSLENRGEWPPDTRVGPYLTCCGATEHTLDCPQFRA